MRLDEEADRRVGGPGHRVERLAAFARDEVVDAEAAAGLQHPEHLGIEACLVLDVHLHVLADHDVEAGVAERQVERVGLAVGQVVAELDALRQHAGDLDERVADVDAGDPAAVLQGHEARRAADAAADVEHLLLVVEAELHGELAGRLVSAHVHLAEAHDVVGSEVVRILALLAQRHEDRGRQRRPRIVRFDARISGPRLARRRCGWSGRRCGSGRRRCGGRFRRGGWREGRRVPRLVDHRIAEPPDALDLHLADVAGLQEQRRRARIADARRRAGGDHVAGLQRHRPRPAVDQVGDREQHGIGGVVLHRLAVDAGHQAQA